MYMLIFYIPESNITEVTNALFDAGAGVIGNYDRCFWRVSGIGSFRPLPGSRPVLGHQEQVETIEECCVQMTCRDEVIEDVIQALKQAHPFETPVYAYWKTEGCL